MRGALVRRSPPSGSRANLVRLGDRGDRRRRRRSQLAERRWAIAHELGHFEAHPDVSFVGLCAGEDMLPELSRRAAASRRPTPSPPSSSCPRELFAPECDVAKLSWEPITALATPSAVSVHGRGDPLRRVHRRARRDRLHEGRHRRVGSRLEGLRPRPARGAPRSSEWNESRVVSSRSGELSAVSRRRSRPARGSTTPTTTSICRARLRDPGWEPRPEPALLPGLTWPWRGRINTASAWSISSRSGNEAPVSERRCPMRMTSRQYASVRIRKMARAREGEAKGNERAAEG